MVKRKIDVGSISDISGEVTIATGDVIKNIQNIYERSLTAAEAAHKSQLIEKQTLAQGVSAFLERIRNRADENTPSTSPYKGLLEYRLSDAEIFYGRDQPISELIELIQHNPLTILQSESGAGKTSLLQAGILPRVIAAGHFPIYLRPYNKTAAEVIKRTFLPDTSLAPTIITLPLAAFLREISAVIGAHSSIYIFIDQFEEFFIRINEAEQTKFIDELAECLDDPSLNVHWLVSLRTEYMGKMGNFQPRIRNPFENSYHLKRFKREEASQIIEKPAHQRGYTFEEGLVDQIITDLGGENVAPPELQLVCTALAEKLNGNSLFTRQIYDAQGCAKGILRSHLEHVFQQLTVSERDIARLILESMVTSKLQRSLRTEKYLLTEFGTRKLGKEKLQPVLQKLIDKRLIRTEETDQEPAYELAHDYLLDEINLNPQTRQYKQAQELLEQGLNNWEKYGILLGPDSLALIEKQIHPEIITPAQAKLLFISSIEYQHRAEKWGNLIGKDELESIKTHFAKDSEKSREAMWALRNRLSQGQKSALAFWKYSRQGTTFGRQIFKAFIYGAFAILVFYIFAIVTAIAPVHYVESLNKQCLGNNMEAAKSLFTAVDASNPSHLISYSSSANLLCESWNSAATWSLVSFGQNQHIVEIALDTSLYLASPTQIFWADVGKTWQQTQSLPANAHISSMGLDPSESKLYISTTSNEIYSKNLGDLDKETDWEKVDVGKIEGNIREITVNYKYFAVNTTQGIWYKLKSAVEWHKFEPLGYKDTVFHSVALSYPKKDFFKTLLNPYTADYVMGIDEGGEIFSGALTENRFEPLKTLESIQDSQSLSVNGTSVFLATKKGLACSQVWSIINKEWWMSKLGPNKPCN